MKTQKRLILMISLSFWVSITYAGEPIKMGYFQLPPHLYYNEEDPDHPCGALIQHFETAAALMGEQVEWVGPFPLLRLVDSLTQGKLDGTVGFYHTARTESYLYIADSPVFQAQPTLMFRQDNPLSEIRSIEDIRGDRIGYLLTPVGIITPLFSSNPDAVILKGHGGENWTEQTIRQLLAGRLEAIYDLQPYTLLFVAARMQKAAEVKTLPVPDPSESLYVVFSKTSQRGKVLLEQYNAVTPKITIDYQDLLQEEFDSAMPP